MCVVGTAVVQVLGCACTERHESRSSGVHRALQTVPAVTCDFTSYAGDRHRELFCRWTEPIVGVTNTHFHPPVGCVEPLS